MKNGIVIDERKLIYWFVPKNACTTVKKVLADAEKLEYRNPHVAPFKRITPDQANQYPEYSQFTILRNPFDRLVSCFRDKIRPGTRNKGFPDGVEYTFDGYGFDEDMTFEQFAEMIFERDLINDHWQPQSDLLPEDVPLVVWFGNLGTELPELLASFGIHTRLPHRNKSKGKREHYSRYYTPELQAKAEQYYRVDCERYGFRFEREKQTKP